MCSVINKHGRVALWRHGTCEVEVQLRPKEVCMSTLELWKLAINAGDEQDSDTDVEDNYDEDSTA